MNPFIDLAKRLWEFVKDITNLAVAQPLPPESFFEAPVIPVPPTPVPPPAPVEVKLTPRERLYLLAKACLTPPMDVSPLDIVDDSVACVESFSEVYRRAFGMYPNQRKDKPELSTIEIYHLFLAMPTHFQVVTVPNPGTIIICVSGTGNGLYYHGHIGICGKFGIMSNTSADGIWRENYTLASWYRNFETKGGFKVHLFDPI